MEKKFKVGLIRVLTTEDQDILLAHEKLLNQYFPMLTVETKCIPDQYEGIHSPELCMLAVPKIVETAKSFRDVDMIIVSCADDPGVEEIREALPGIPVTGGGETTLALARKYGEKIGVLGITDYAPKAYAKLKSDQLLIGRPGWGIQHTGSYDIKRQEKYGEYGKKTERTGGGCACSCLYRHGNDRNSKRA